MPSPDALPPIVAAPRADRVRTRLLAQGLDALIVSDLSSIRWLTGFTGSSAAVVLGHDRLVLVTDGRYGAQAAQESAHVGVQAEVVVARSSGDLDASIVAAVPAGARVGFESARVTHRTFSRWSAELAERLVPTVGLLESARRHKDVAELARIRRAAAIADQALADVIATIAPGCTESAVRDALEQRMRALGAAGPSYDTIVAAGPRNASMPHHRPTPTVIEAGHTVVIDVGALVDGYHSDMTRSFLVGPPNDEQVKVYESVREAQAAGLAAIRAGVPAVSVDAACREVLADAGLGPWFSHGTGHGVGLDIHEEPFLGATSTAVLEVGDVVTVEPGVYRDDFGGIRIEDLVEVTATGCRVITQSPKDAPCLPSAPTT